MVHRYHSTIHIRMNSLDEQDKLTNIISNISKKYRLKVKKTFSEI